MPAAKVVNKEAKVVPALEVEVKVASEALVLEVLVLVAKVVSEGVL